MSLESALDKPPPMLGGDSNQSGEEDKERSSSSHGINSTLLYPMNQSTFTALDGVSSHKAGQRALSDEEPVSESPAPEQQDEQKEEEQQDLLDLEDGELEDGELDDEDDATTDVPPAADEVAELEPEAEAELEAEKFPQEFGMGESGSQKEKATKENPASAAKSDSDDSGDDEREKRRKKKKKKRKREEREREKKKKKKNPKYVDHDQVADDYPDYPTKSWSGAHYSRSPPGPYDSPYDSPPSLEQSPPHGFQALDSSSRAFERSPPGPYDSPYDSPPGPYDSPSDDEYGPPPKLKRMESRDKSQKRMKELLSDKSEKHSLMDLYGGEYMDSNVAASEREELFDRRRKASEGSRQRKLEKAQRYKELMRKREQEAAERRSASKQQQCKFFMDGKCQRGRDCPFSHDFQPPRKLEVCKFYMINACAKGEKCLYMHDDYPCRSFLLDGRCSEKDDCLFSHREQEEYEEELQPLIQKFLRGEDYESTQQRKRDGGTREREREHERESPRKRPSLLGSPPRNLENKSIPSIFDIKVYPPGQGPPSSQSSPAPTGMGSTSGTAGPRGPMGGPMPPPGGGAPGNRPMRPFRDPRMPMGMPGPGMMGMPGPRGMMMPPMGMDSGPFRPPGPGNFYGGNFYQPQPGDQPPDIESPEVKEGQDGSLQDKADKSSDAEKMAGSLTGDIQAIPGVDKSDLEDIAAHLPPVQRELFLRIQRQQQQKIPEGPTSKKDEEENWYSSDEESPAKQPENKPKQQQQPPQQPVMGSAMPVGNQVNPMARMNVMPGMGPPTAPGFDISQMLSAIRQSMAPLPGTAGTSWPGMTNPQLSASDPRTASTAKSSDPRTSKSRSTDPRRGPAPVSGIKLAIPEIDATVSTTGGVKYILYSVAVPLDQGLPPHVDKTDPRYKNDPRVHKPEQRKLRRQSTEKYKDPRMLRTDAHPKSILDIGSRTVSAPGNNSSPPSDTYTPSKTYSLPEALTQMPKLLDPRLAKQFSGSATASLDLDTESTKPESRVPFSHRNDPRFKFKKKSKDIASEETVIGLSSPSGDTTSINKETAVKDPRKRGLEHASPLELDSTVDRSSSYSSYNKLPNPSFKVKKDFAGSANGSPSSRNTDTPPGVESLGALPSINEDVDSLPDLPVKDIFKTIDPTASPFC